MEEVNDNEILYMIQENDDIYEIFLQKYKPLINKISYKYLKYAKSVGYEIDDLYQIASISLYEAVRSYRDNQGSLFYTYLYHCIDNNIKTELRNQNTKKKLALNESISYDKNYLDTDIPLINFLKDENAIDPFDYMLNRELEIKYINFINSLSFENAIIFEMRNDGFRLKEISLFLKLSVNEINYRLRGINKKLECLK